MGIGPALKSFLKASNIFPPAPLGWKRAYLKVQPILSKVIPPNQFYVSISHHLTMTFSLGKLTCPRHINMQNHFLKLIYMEVVKLSFIPQHTQERSSTSY